MDAANVTMEGENTDVNASHHAGKSGNTIPNFPGDSPAPMVEIKLFVGRVPPSMDEKQLKPVFEEFGEVREIVIIRDKATSKHKNSAFVKMASIAFADAAIRGLSTLRTLDTSLGPMTVKYATGEAEKLGLTSSAAEPGVDQSKLFIGSIPKTLNEDGIREFFSTYGNVEEVFVMKDNVTNQGRGCAFVKFSFKEEALFAIKSLNGKHTFSGCSRPVEVRFAETRAQRQQQMQLGAARTGVRGGMNDRVPGATGAAMGMVRPGVGAAGMPSVTVAGAIPNNSNPRQAGRWKEYFTSEGRAYYHNEVTSVTTWERPSEFLNFPPPPSMVSAGGVIPANASVGGGDAADSSGPPGANIFVFHVPNEWSYYDLFNHFTVFGNVISARVATDRSTGRNRGFAFVSYDNIEAASSAVNAMNGFVVNGKRLKVTIKKGEEQFVQHLLSNQSQNQNAGAAVGSVRTANAAGNANWAAGTGTYQNAQGAYQISGPTQRFNPY